MDLAKVKSITNWPTLERLRDGRGFLGFANFYRRFGKGYSEIIRPMTLLTKNDYNCKRNQDRQNAFNRLKNAVTRTPILAHFDFERKNRRFRLRWSTPPRQLLQQEARAS